MARKAILRVRIYYKVVKCSSELTDGGGFDRFVPSERPTGYYPTMKLAHKNGKKHGSLLDKDALLAFRTNWEKEFPDGYYVTMCSIIPHTKIPGKGWEITLVGLVTLEGW